MTETLPYGPNITVEIRDVASGRVLDVRKERNLITTAGKQVARDLLLGSGTPPSQFAAGTGSTAATVSDVALVAEVLRQDLTGKTASGNTASFRYYMGSPTGNGTTFREVGLYAGSTLFARAVLGTPISKTNLIAVTFVWDITPG